MHGLILTEFREYVQSSDQTPPWSDIAQQAGVASREYVNGEHYPDEEVLAVVAATAELQGASEHDVLVEYGTYVTYSLIDIYKPLIEDGWGSLEFMLEVEERFHPTVRDRSRAKPPYLNFERQGPDEVTLTYRSPRKLCALAIGVARALEDVYDENMEIVEERCMHEGADECFIRFARSPDAQATSAPAMSHAGHG